MITKQKIYQDGDKICLRNTVDVSSAVDAARRVNEIDNGGWAGDKNERIQLMGFIPPEFWGFDPWLICAKRAELEGNQAKYQYYIQKFFSVWKQFAVNHKNRTWRGAVLLG